MKCCTFCSNEAEMLFYHMTNNIGMLCLDCFMKLQGACSVCNESLLPDVIEEDSRYRVEAKFIGMGEKIIVVCDGCYEGIRRRFPEMMA